MVAKVFEVGVGEMSISGKRGLLQSEDGDLLGMRDGKGTEKEAIDDAKEGGVDSHAEGKGDDADKGEAGILREGAKGVLNVSPEIEHVGELPSEIMDMHAHSACLKRKDAKACRILHLK